VFSQDPGLNVIHFWDRSHSLFPAHCRPGDTNGVSFWE
jgi:hypothetical protein